ncbi:unnamed protein product [Paramecium pentaurelia]|uniref:Uncharacterized protein n=1 Tax=Paramecium pentaurelia TaxID=43138 RepID=A0A8S1YH02_9CILI|nr:unnamed protein product [Paramecium pentaurelia]
MPAYFIFVVLETQNPLREKLYFETVHSYGHTRGDQLIQAYQINSILIRFWDYDVRVHNFIVFTSYKDSSDEIQIFEGYANGIIQINFSDRQVQKIRIHIFGQFIQQ